MPRISRFQALKRSLLKIRKFFQKSIKKVYSENEIRDVFSENKSTWILPKITKLEEFLNFLINEKVITKYIIDMPSRKIQRYAVGETIDFSIASSVNKNAYLCHYTAMFIHELTENIPKNIYINIEQKEKGENDKDSLIQLNIDRAFSRPMRKTNQIGTLNDSKVYLLNGKNVGNIGVIDIDFKGTNLKITNLERTLIDITVRPNYAGGVNEVLNAYILAKGKCSINKLIAILKQLDYTYPYHQSIGFYLEKAKYPKNIIDLVKKIEIKYNFYLTYEIKDKEFSDTWKLFFPKGF